MLRGCKMQVEMLLLLTANAHVYIQIPIAHHLVAHFEAHGIPSNVYLFLSRGLSKRGLGSDQPGS